MDLEEYFQNGCDPPLLRAAFSGDVDNLERLLKVPHHRVHLNTSNRLGCTPARLAATGGHIGCVNLLILEGAKIDIPDVKCQTALFMAVKNKHQSCVTALLQSGARPDGDEGNLCTPLYIAAMDGNVAAIKELVEYGADLHRCQMGSIMSTPLYISVAYHHYEAFRMLLLAGSDPDFSCRRSLNSGIEPVTEKHQSLYHAIIQHNLEPNYLDILYECGAHLYYRNDQGKLACDMGVEPKECSEYIQEFYMFPRNLKSTCRIVIRKAIGRDRLKMMRSLPLPNQCLSYLNFDTSH